MGTTPVFSIPYVESTAHLNAYPAADKAQADRLDAAVPQVAAGLVTATMTTAPTATVAVVFPTGRFTSTPYVLTTVRSGSMLYAYASAALSTTGVTLTIKTMSGGAAVAGSYQIDWLAVRGNL